MKSLVIGDGEVGKSLAEVLGCEVIGRTDLKTECDILHICFPFGDEFSMEVKRYIKLFEPQYTIVHSTVPIGTSRKLGVYHSPTRGMHPYLAESIRTFVTYIAPYNKELVEYLRAKGMTIMPIVVTEDTEALKLFDTLQYGLMIMIEKEIYKYCQEHHLDFDLVYTRANTTYNKGYLKMGRENVIRPILNHMEGKIGGHCVVQNAHLLDTWLSKILRDRNKTYT